MNNHHNNGIINRLVYISQTNLDLNAIVGHNMGISQKTHGYGNK